jgi:hypothetical protein
MPNFDIHIRGHAEQLTGVVNRAIGSLNAGLVGSLRSRLLGLLGAGAIAQQVRGLMQFADAIQNASEKFNVSAEFLQVATAAMEETGGSIGDVTVALRRLAIVQAAAITGNKAAGATFDSIGLSIANLRGMNAEDLFTRIADGVKRGAINADQLQRLLGRSASNLVPMFRNGFSEIRGEMESTGAIIDASLIKKLDDIGDAMTRLKTRFRAELASIIAITEQVGRGLGGKGLGEQGGPSKMGFWGAILFPAAGSAGAMAEAVKEFMTRIQTGILSDIGTGAVSGFVAGLEAGPRSTAAAEEEVATRRRRGAGLNLRADDLARLGLFASPGAASQTQESILLQRRTLNEQKTTNRKLDEVRDAVNDTLD